MRKLIAAAAIFLPVISYAQADRQKAYDFLKTNSPLYVVSEKEIVKYSLLDIGNGSLEVQARMLTVGEPKAIEKDQNALKTAFESNENISVYCLKLDFRKSDFGKNDTCSPASGTFAPEKQRTEYESYLGALYDAIVKK